MRQKLLLTVAVIFGLLAFMFTYQQIQQEKRRIQGSATEVLLVGAAQAMSEGQELKEENMKLIRTKRFAGNISSDIPWDKRENYIGAVLQVGIPAGTPINQNYLRIKRSSGGRGLAREVKSGMRAISIPVDATSSITGLVQPGNIVDLIGTFRFPDTKGDSSLDTITLTLLQKVRIIATGTDFGSSPLARNTGNRSFSTVTLELTPKEVEMIVFATQKGRLTLSLRNYEDSKFSRDGDLQSVDWSYLQKNIQQYRKDREAQ